MSDAEIRNQKQEESQNNALKFFLKKFQTFWDHMKSKMTMHEICNTSFIGNIEQNNFTLVK